MDIFAFLKHDFKLHLNISEIIQIILKWSNYFNKLCDDIYICSITNNLLYYGTSSCLEIFFEFVPNISLLFVIFSGPESDSSSIIIGDDFKIGDRVWVGGSKPGIIAFIGDTQFAPGEWAGVVLDDPVGKNDGSVMGIRYFQVIINAFFLVGSLYISRRKSVCGYVSACEHA